MLNTAVNGLSGLNAGFVVPSRLTLSVAGFAATLVLIDLALLIARRMHYLDVVQHAKRQRWLRILLVFAVVALDLIITFEFWTCAPATQPSLTSCTMVFLARNISSSMIPIWLLLNFFENSVRVTIFTVGEIILALSLSGQPTVMRLTKPLYSIFEVFLLLVVQWWLEQEDRQRFLALVRRELLQQQVQGKQKQIATTLQSITDQDQLELLLAGQDTVHDREVCTVLVARFESLIE